MTNYFKNKTSRRSFLHKASTIAAITASTLAGGALFSKSAFSLGRASQIDLVQIVYSGGNWHPRPSALRRLAWEIHKRTSVETVLEPSHFKSSANLLAQSPFAYLSGDRTFPAWKKTEINNLTRFLRLGGTLVIDPAFSPDADIKGFKKSVNDLMKSTLDYIKPQVIEPNHVIFRSFYNLPRATGRVQGSRGLSGYKIGQRVAVIIGDHDMGGAWARDNLGNWEYEVQPGGNRQREQAFRLGINIVMYALCADYKNEQPHRRFSSSNAGGN